MAAPIQRKPITYKVIDGKIVKPVRYIGSYGDYMAGKVGDDIIIDINGRPIPYKQIFGDKPVN